MFMAKGPSKKPYDPRKGLVPNSSNAVRPMQRLPANWRAEREAMEKPRLKHLRGEWMRVRGELIKRGETEASLAREMATFVKMMHNSYNARMRLEQWLGEVERRFGASGSIKKHGIVVNWEMPKPKK
jgi:hypothetical protein